MDRILEESYFSGDTIEGKIEISNFKNYKQGEIVLESQAYEEALWVQERQEENEGNQLEDNVLEADEYEI